jgi:outer membrane immunogenic protein
LVAAFVEISWYKVSGGSVLWEGQVKRFLFATAAFGVLALPAMAADLAPIYKAPPVLVCSWCGFYFGANAGGTWSSDNSMNLSSGVAQDFFAGPNSFGAASAAGVAGRAPTGNQAGFIGGGQIGYNWQMSPVWLFGVETDIQGATGNSSGTLGTSVGPIAFAGNPDTLRTTITASKQLNYIGTVRERVGYLWTPTFLVYGTGGLAYGGVKASTAISQSNDDCVFFAASCVQSATGAAGSISQTRVGWTAGGGWEWMFASRWSAKVEYLYYDLGTVNFVNSPLVTGPNTFPGAGGPVIVGSGGSAEFRGNIARAGINYHW